MHKSKYLYICIFSILSFIQVKAQQRNIPLNRDVYHYYDHVLSDKNIDFHSGVKPYNFLTFYRAAGSDSLIKEKKEFDIVVNPVTKSMIGYDLSEKRLVSDASIGFDARLNYGEKLGAQLNYLRGQTVLPSYLDSVARHNSVVPGFGYAWYGAGQNTYVYQNISGALTYAPNKIFTLEAGLGKHFWGDGYRSLFLSDNSYNYPYLKVNTHVWKFNYTNLFVNFKDINGSNGVISKYRNKYAAFHQLSYNATKWLNLALFETIVFQNRNNDLTKFGYDINYLNPVIFFRPVEYSLGSADNAIVGVSAKIRPFKKIALYGQLILDEFLLANIKARNGWWANKYGLQAGLKWFDLFTVKGLYLQGEVNYVRPYTYSHGDPMINYGHFNQPLAHPAGANFYEGVGIVRYDVKRFLIEAKVNYLVYGADSAGKNMGQNIFNSYSYGRPRDFGNYNTQGIKTTVAIAELRCSYTLIKSINLRVEASLMQRMQTAQNNNLQTRLISIGIKTSLYNQYLDF